MGNPLGLQFSIALCIVMVAATLAPAVRRRIPRWFETAVWVGNPDWRQKMTQGSDSFYTAAPVWHNFMQQAMAYLKLKNEWYPRPGGLVSRMVAGKIAYYLPGTH